MTYSDFSFGKMNTDQIVIELVKKIPDMDESDSVTISELFGNGWGYLDGNSRDLAEIKFKDNITKKNISGISFRVNSDDVVEYFVKHPKYEQLYFEIIKMSQFVDFGEILSLRDIYGVGWDFISESVREKVEKKLQKGIRDQDVRGIVFKYNYNNKTMDKNEDGDVLYERIHNDEFHV